MTVFEKIAAGELPAQKIYEDDKFLAVLDLFPSRPGQTVVFPKKQVSSKLTQVPVEILSETMIVAQNVARKLEAKLENIERVLLLVEGLELDHFHIKLYPVYLPTPTDQVVSPRGTQSTQEELAKVASLINS